MICGSAMAASDYLFDGPEGSAHRLVLAHGAGAPMDSPFMATFAEGLGGRGIRVARFEFPYMRGRRTGGGKRPPDRAPALRQSWLEVIAALGRGPGLVIGGKSMGGRIATEAGSDAPKYPVELKLRDRTIRFYEVHWADVLKGNITHGSFSFSSLLRVVWFPGFNERKNCYPSGAYTWARGYLWTVGLLFLLIPLWLVLKGFSKIFNLLKHSTAETDAFAATLDETAGDVVNYVKSRAKTHPPESSELADVAEEICAHFHKKVKQASEECSEVWVVAHSLGTVVAYDGLTGATLQTVEADSTSGVEPFEKLKRLYTLGCPLEKILFFWPCLLGTSLVGRVLYGDGDARPKRIKAASEGKLPESFRWYNFHHWADSVAGKLTHFDRWRVENCPVRARGGFIKSHTLYYSHPTVHEVLGKELLGPTVNCRQVSGRLRSFLAVLVENLLAFIVSVFSLVLGLGVLAGILVSPAVAIGLGVGLAGDDEQMRNVLYVIVGTTVLLMLVGGFRQWMINVDKEHDKYTSKLVPAGKKNGDNAN